MAKKTSTKTSQGVPVNTAPSPYKPSAAEKKMQQRYQAEDAIRTLTRAEEIKKDVELMRNVKKHAAEQVKTMQKVCKS
jgi:hypothetical protein